MKKSTIYVLAKNSTLWNDEHHADFDLIIVNVKYYYNDYLLINGWIDLNTVLSALGFPKEIDKVALGWKYNSTLEFKDYCVNIDIVAKDDEVYLAFHNIVNLLEEDDENNEN